MMSVEKDRGTGEARQPAKSLNVSNEVFLRAVFAGAWERAHITGFKQDPSAFTQDDRYLWGGGAAKDWLPAAKPETNNFFTISIFKPDPASGKARRRKALFERAMVVVLDDVDWRDAGVGSAGAGSAKVSRGRVRAIPSWVLETSPGNCQVGYILDGGDARGGKVAAFLDALVASGLCMDGSDPGMKGVTRYVRLPVGTNTKAKYGAEGHAHRLLEWNPGTWYSLENLADAYGVRAAVDAAEDDLGAGVWSGAGAGVSGSGLEDGDVIWEVLQASGSVLSVDPGKGLAHVICPWVSEHSGGETSGTAYLGGGAWMCHHGHCVDYCDERDYARFSDRLRALFPAEWAAAVGGSFGAVGGDEGVAPSARVREMEDIFGVAAVAAAAEEAETVKVLPRESRSFWMSDAEKAGAVLDMPWLVKGLIPPEGVGVLYGPPGTGKSFVALDLAARVALGLNWQGLRVKKTGMVLYVASEGGTQSLRNRVVAWMAGNGTGPGNVLVYPGALALGRDGETGGPEKVAKWAKKQAGRAGVPVAMVVIDTLARNMSGDENATADMNAFVGACDAIQKGTGAFVLLVHHTGKDASKGSRGSSALLGAIDLEMELAREPGLGSVGTVYVSKAREGDLVGKTYGYALRKIVFGQDQDGDDVTSLYVEEVALPAGGGSGRPGKGSNKPFTKRAQALADAYEELVSGSETGYVDQETVVVRSQDLHNADHGTRPTAAKMRYDLKDILVGKHGWVTNGNGIKSPGWTPF